MNFLSLARHPIFWEAFLVVVFVFYFKAGRALVWLFKATEDQGRMDDVVERTSGQTSAGTLGRFRHSGGEVIYEVGRPPEKHHAAVAAQRMGCQSQQKQSGSAAEGDRTCGSGSGNVVGG